jgi:hypothetical protein
LGQVYTYGGIKPVNGIPLCIMDMYFEVLQRALFANRSVFVESNSALSLRDSIAQLYKSDFLVDIYFGGYMKGKKILFCFILLLIFV